MFPPNGIGDLFDMLLPMLSIYQEYVRNHHFSLQVLAECKQREKFASMLRRLEEKPVIQGKRKKERKCKGFLPILVET